MLDNERAWILSELDGQSQVPTRIVFVMAGLKIKQWIKMDSKSYLKNGNLVFRQSIVRNAISTKRTI